jgi:hypothetical protein
MIIFDYRTIFMKLIVAIWNSHSKGKTGTLRKVAELLYRQPGAKIQFEENFIAPKGRDFTVVFKIARRMIGIESKGDPGTKIRIRLQRLLNFNCQIILCSTRMKGATAKAVSDLAKANKFKIYWTSTYEPEPANHDEEDFLNRIKARHLVNLLKKTALI